MRLNISNHSPGEVNLNTSNVIRRLLHTSKIISQFERPLPVGKSSIKLAMFITEFRGLFSWKCVAMTTTWRKRQKRQLHRQIANRQGQHRPICGKRLVYHAYCFAHSDRTSLQVSAMAFPAHQLHVLKAKRKVKSTQIIGGLS